MSRHISSAQEILRRFDHLNKALIDASSIIYANRAGFLDLLASAITLFSIEEIFVETGPVSESIKPLIHNDKSSSNDRKLIACALDMDLPVISEDKKILMAMRRANRPFYNALMILNFLLYRRRIDIPEYDQYRRALEKFARYSDEVWQYGVKIQAAIKELI